MSELKRNPGIQGSSEDKELPATPSAIEFDGFSYWDDEKKTFTSPSVRSRQALLKYLSDNFDVFDIMECGPYLVLPCKTLPEPSIRPFTIAGCVAVWIEEDGGLPAEIGLGDLANGADLDLPDELRRDLHPYKIPSVAILMEVAKFFPDACITFLNTGLIVELPEQDPEKYYEALQSLPGGLARCGITLGYNNGDLAPTAMMKNETSKPQHIDDAKLLLGVDEVQFGDEIIIDSSVKGPQRLKYLGKRMSPARGLKRERDTSVSQESLNLLPRPGKHVAFVQGIYATSVPVMDSGPMICGGGCCSAVVRSRQIGSIGAFLLLRSFSCYD